jgi:hypothetical protein
MHTDSHGYQIQEPSLGGVRWCELVYYDAMNAILTHAETVRRSVTLPPEIAEKIDVIAAERRVSSNRAIVDLLREAIEAYGHRREAFMELADRFHKAKSPAQAARLREELARMTFGS